MALGEQLGRWLDEAPFGVSSMDPSDARFDGHRYWRGPSWLIINFLLLRGLRQGGQLALAQRVVDASMACIDRGGFSEYYHPVTGQALGGGTFTWSAAMVVEFLTAPDHR